MTQNEKIKKYLTEGKRLTAIDALSMFNCFRLAARIDDLKKEGLNIKRKMINTPYSNKQVAEYYI